MIIKANVTIEYWNPEKTAMRRFSDVSMTDTSLEGSAQSEEAVKDSLINFGERIYKKGVNITEKGYTYVIPAKLVRGFFFIIHTEKEATEKPSIIAKIETDEWFDRLRSKDLEPTTAK